MRFNRLLFTVLVMLALALAGCAQQNAEFAPAAREKQQLMRLIEQQAARTVELSAECEQLVRSPGMTRPQQLIDADASVQQATEQMLNGRLHSAIDSLQRATVLYISVKRDANKAFTDISENYDKFAGTWVRDKDPYVVVLHSDRTAKYGNRAGTWTVNSAGTLIECTWENGWEDVLKKSTDKTWINTLENQRWQITAPAAYVGTWTRSDGFNFELLADGIAKNGDHLGKWTTSKDGCVVECAWETGTKDIFKKSGAMWFNTVERQTWLILQP